MWGLAEIPFLDRAQQKHPTCIRADLLKKIERSGYQ